MNNDLNLTVVQTKSGNVMALMQNHTVIYIPCNDHGRQLAQGMMATIEEVEKISKQNTKPNIVHPPDDFNPRKPN